VSKLYSFGSSGTVPKIEVKNALLGEKFFYNQTFQEFLRKVT